MLRALEAQAPPKQNATDTINILSGRLVDATLLEDRRGAILGLRSFAKQYPATVASGSLRALISTLSKDIEDVDTGKVVLETLLGLFHFDENSPEASADIRLWLADEFSVRQDNISVLLRLLDLDDFYARLYALQLLTAVCEARLERTQECILADPLGTSKLVDLINPSVEPREPIRSAALALLIDLTQGSIELQKSIAFQGAFEYMFQLIQSDGSIIRGDVAVQDCLSLLHNLVNLNPSNQNIFRETGFVQKLCDLLRSIDEKPDDDLPGPSPSQDKNIWGLLKVLRLFLDPDSRVTQSNQIAFVRSGLHHYVLRVGFDSSIGLPIRAESFRTCADMIRGTAKIQEDFGGQKVRIPVPDESNANSHTSRPTAVEDYVIDALLDVTFSSAPISMFDVRFAACQCTEAWFEGHPRIKSFAMSRAVGEFFNGQDYGVSVLLKVLMAGPTDSAAADPYHIWFAAYLVFKLLYGEPEVQNILIQLKEGNAAEGEEVVTCIQTFTGHLLAALQTGQDDRICIAYLMVLCGWFLENSEAVNDFLSEGSVLRTLVEMTAKRKPDRELIQGICALLLGLVYEYSTKDSPITRKELKNLLDAGLNRETYLQRLSELRHHEILRQFDATPQDLSSVEPGSLPLVFFNVAFVDFVMDMYRPMKLAFDKDPSIEAMRPHEGIDRNFVDTLQSQLNDKDEALKRKEDSLKRIESDAMNQNNRIEQLKAELSAKEAQHQADLRNRDARSQSELRSKDDKFQNERATMKKINDALHEEIEKTHANHDAALRDAKTSHSIELERSLAQERKRHEDATAKLSHEISTHQKRVATLESTLKQTQDKLDSTTQELTSSLASRKSLETEISTLTAANQVLEETNLLTTTNTRRLEEQVRDLDTRVRTAREAEQSIQSVLDKREAALQAELEAKEDARATVQSEMEDLLIVLGDLEEKRTRDKKKLKELGAEISDDEEDDEDEDGDEDEEGDSDEHESDEDEDAEDAEDEDDDSGNEKEKDKPEPETVPAKKETVNGTEEPKTTGKENGVAKNANTASNTDKSKKKRKGKK